MPLTSIENLSLGKENARPKKELVGKVEKNKEVEEKVKRNKEEMEEPLLKENPRRFELSIFLPKISET